MKYHPPFSPSRDDDRWAQEPRAKGKPQDYGHTENPSRYHPYHPFNPFPARPKKKTCVEKCIDEQDSNADTGFDKEKWDKCIYGCEKPKTTSPKDKNSNLRLEDS